MRPHPTIRRVVFIRLKKPPCFGNVLVIHNNVSKRACVCQSGGDWSLQRSAAVFLEGTEAINISHCTFKYLGGIGFMVSGATTYFANRSAKRRVCEVHQASPTCKVRYRLPRLSSPRYSSSKPKLCLCV